ncbi:hypothetical protein [Lysobacter hankyongensis]|uniref:Alginate lyase domain-containing protein n=1 Tax=Lysobacter hankyongensis TaxID=1176535 RepID=A0ABP9C213_9GAMM
MRKVRGIVFVMMDLLAVGLAAAHNINPLQNKYGQDSGMPLGRVAEPVHEEITQLARACMQAHPGPVHTPLICADDTERSIEPRGNKYDSLVRGVWWNDDPNQLLFALRQGRFLSWMHDARLIATTGRNWQGKPAAIGSDYYLTYRSHYGDLQFLHAMASGDGEPAATTRHRALLWAEFAYLVATGRLDPETKMDRISPVELRDYFEEQSGWTINFLFAYHYQLKGDAHKRMMAAGSLLHMVQDSYSAAHAQRFFEPTAECPNGGIVQFHSYTCQDPSAHKREDLRSAWLQRGFTPTQDPVNVSATLLGYIRQDADWNIVRDYLEGTVFCLAEDARNASPGDYAMAAESVRLPAKCKH